MNKSVKEELKKWSLQIRNDVSLCDFKVLDPGNVIMDKNKEVPLSILSSSPNNHQFRNNYFTIFSNKFSNFPSMDNWGIIAFEADEEKCNFLLELVVAMVSKHNYNVTEPEKFVVGSPVASEWIDFLSDKLNNIKFLMVVIPSVGFADKFYQDVKYWLTFEKGILSQFVRADTIASLQSGKDTTDTHNFIVRIFSQIAAKFGASPWALKGTYFNKFATITIGRFLKNPIMIKIQ